MCGVGEVIPSVKKKNNNKGDPYLRINTANVVHGA